MSRKPVAAVQTTTALVVVCEDGSVWFTTSPGMDKEWKEGVPIPGSQADPTSVEEIPDDMRIPDDLGRESPFL